MSHDQFNAPEFRSMYSMQDNPSVNAHNLRKLGLVLILALGCNVSLSNNIKPLLSEHLQKQPLLIADRYDPNDDPGKDITDDPHGAGAHGPNPHGRDPHDEIHDEKAPANDPDSYFKDGDKKGCISTPSRIA